MTVNVGALPDTLLEAELFGAEAGAFTGAQRRRIGRFEAAHGGTLFLDEIGTLSLAGQAKLLRVLQTGEFERLGSSTTLRGDVRLLCATNVAPARGDRGGPVPRGPVLPAERDRAGGAGPRATAPTTSCRLPSTCSRRGRRRTAPLSPAAEQALLAHAWPGNVRELQNRLQRARLVASGDEITPDDLGPERGVRRSCRDRSRRRTERQALEEVLRIHRRQRLARRRGARAVAPGAVSAHGTARRRRSSGGRGADVFRIQTRRADRQRCCAA